MSKYIHPCTLEAAYEVASNLSPLDAEECIRGHGIIPIQHIPLSVLKGDNVYFTVPDGRIAGLAGVYENGQIWMLTTPAVQDFPHTFAREAKRFVLSRKEERLWNIVYAKNVVHIKLLKWLGFKLGGELFYGPNNEHFIEFQRCAHLP